MFKLSIRELLLLTLIVGMGISWWMDRRTLAAVREDAEVLARYGRPFHGACGCTAGFWHGVASKYERTNYGLERVTLSEDEAAALALDFAP